MPMDLKEAHDLLLTVAPSGAVHDATECQFCTGANETASASPSTANNNNQTIDSPEGGAVSDKTHTDDEVQTAVAKATADLASELADLKAQVASKDQEAETAQAIADAVAAKDAELADLHAQLDAKVLEAEATKKELADLVTLIQSETARQEEEAELAARRDERLAKVASVASFPEEYVAANADRWAGMDEAAFEAICADYATVANKDTAATEPTLSDIPRETAIQNERAGLANRSDDRLSATKEILSGALSGVRYSSL